MKPVLYLLRYFPTLTETFVYREMAAMPVPLRLAAMQARADGALQDEGPTQPCWRPPRWAWRGWLRPQSVGQRWLAAHQRPWQLRAYGALLRHLEEEPVGHVHVHFAGEAAEWACALRQDLGLPYTVTVHAVDLFKPRPSLVELLSGAREVLAVAEHHRGLLAGLGLRSRLCRCGPAPVEPSTPPDGPLRALFVGRNVPKKGLDILLEAWAAAPEGALLELITDPAPPALPPGVRLLGLQAPSGVRAALGRCQVLVLPCQRAPDGDLDGVPVALMEALAAGRPVITTPVSGIPELVDEEVGWLVPPGSAPALAEALRAASDPAERLRRGAAGPARLHERSFTISAQVQSALASWGEPWSRATSAS